MATPIRWFEPETVYFITSRCAQSRLLMRPCKITNEMIGATLARAARLYEVEVFAFSFTSNHLHLMVRAKAHWRIARFMQFLQSNIARKVGKFVDWAGRFFGRRYSAEPIVDDAAIVERLQYILAHGVKEGLVSRCVDWPGLSAWQMLKDDQTRSFRWLDWTKRWFMHRDSGKNINHFGDDCPTQEESLRLAIIPPWRQLSKEQRCQRLNAMEAQINAAGQAEKVLGREQVLLQDPLSKPRHSKRSPRPKCHASSIDLWREFIGRLKEFLAAYRIASQLWHLGERLNEIEFPNHCFRPPPPFCQSGESCGT